MVDQELLAAIGQMMEAQKKELSDMIDEKLKPIQKDISELKADVATIKEDLADLREEHSMTREGVNKLLGWADTAGYIIKFPLDKAN